MKLTHIVSEVFFRDKDMIQETERTLRFWRERERCFLQF
jgi:hypothetical protein